MELTQSAARFASVIAKQGQADALRRVRSVVEEQTRHILSHLSVADRELVRSVTGEVITHETTSASDFALTLAQSRIQHKTQSLPLDRPSTLVSRSPQPNMHERIATFTSMRALIGSNAVGRSLDLEA